MINIKMYWKYICKEMFIRCNKIRILVFIWRVFFMCFNFFFGLIGSLYFLIVKKLFFFFFLDKDIINFGYWKSFMFIFFEGVDFFRWLFVLGFVLVVGRVFVLVWLLEVFLGFISLSLFSCKFKFVFLVVFGLLLRILFVLIFFVEVVVLFFLGFLIFLMLI